MKNGVELIECNTYSSNRIIARTRSFRNFMKTTDKYLYESSDETTKTNHLIVVTPVRNEESMLSDLVRDMTNQSVKPVVWVIVDDGSSDKTWLTIKDLEKEFSWISGVRLEPKQENTYAHERYTEVVRKGFEHAIEICRKCTFKYDFIAVTDADVRLESDYFEKIIKAFQSNRRLGIASGFVYEKGMSLKELQESNAKPRGCALVFRKECYEMIDGFQGHTNSLVKAQNRNWHIETFTSPKVFHRRKSWSGRKYFSAAGKSAYFLNYHPINAFLTGIYYVIKVSPRKGLSYLTGYFESFILRKKKTQDKEIKEYFWSSFNRLLTRIAKKLWKD
jgi:glycosyltransferase involved in cell wall biosynthesis